MNEPIKAELTAKIAAQNIQLLAEVERLRKELAEYDEEFPVIQNDLGKALLRIEILRASLKEIAGLGVVCASDMAVIALRNDNDKVESEQ